jgi:CRP-like cAMP-binding protein
VRQGDAASHFYIVTEGEVEVERENGDRRILGRFGAGFHFGELALLADQARTATVRAVSPCRVLELPARAFRRHLMEIPVARYRIRSEADARHAAIRHPGK